MVASIGTNENESHTGNSYLNLISEMHMETILRKETHMGLWVQWFFLILGKQIIQ